MSVTDFIIWKSVMMFITSIQEIFREIFESWKGVRKQNLSSSFYLIPDLFRIQIFFGKALTCW